MRRTKLRPPWGIFRLLPVSFLVLHAGRDACAQSARTLDSLVIRGAALSARDTSATPAQILKGRDLEKLNSLSVADAVRFFSGVQLKDYGGIGGLKTINVRSLGSNHTAVFYDGVELGNATNGQVDLGKFSLDNMEEIALYDGQKSTIFQPAAGFAAGNSLYLTARAPVFPQGRSDREKFTFRTGSFGLVNPSALFQYRLRPKLYASLSAEWINANGHYKFRETNGVYDTTATRTNADIDAHRVEASLYGNGRDSSGGWSAKFYFYNSARGLPGAIVANNFNYPQRLWDRNWFLQSAWHQGYGRWSVQLSGKYSNNYSRYLDPWFVTVDGFLDNRYHEQEVYLSASQLYAINSFWNVSLSNDYKFNTLDANLYHFSYPTRNTILNVAATELHFPRFNLQGNLLNTIVEDKVRDYESAGNKTEWTPALLFSWQPFSKPGFRIRGFYKNIFRMPTFNDLYYTFIGYTLLRPEFAKQYDLGFTLNRITQGNHPLHWSIQADAYYNLVTDKIVAVPGKNLFRWQMQNIGKVSVHGVSVNAQATCPLPSGIQLTAALTYTWEQSLDITGGDNYGDQIPYTPVNSGTALLSAAWRKLSMNYSYIYTGYRYDEAANIPANYVQPWYTHDIALTFTSAIWKHGMKLSAEINNLFNQYYDVITNFPMPGRSYRFTLQINY